MIECETINSTSIICDFLNSILFKIFLSINNTIYSSLDNILFINSDILNDIKFNQIFGSDSTNGILLVANSLIFGIILFYILSYTLSHLIYFKIDSPIQFIFKCIIFIACMNSSLWICEKIICLITIVSDSIKELGSIIIGSEINISNLINQFNLYTSFENFDVFSFNGLLKITISIISIYILIVYSIRFIICKILILLSPFAFSSLIFNHSDGFFKSWLKQLLIMLSMQILVALALVLGFCIDFDDSVLSKSLFISILIIIAKCNFYIKELFSNIYEYSKNSIKNLGG